MQKKLTFFLVLATIPSSDFLRIQGHKHNSLKGEKEEPKSLVLSHSVTERDTLPRCR